MPWVMNMEVKNILVDVVDNDRSTLSQQLVHEIEASKYFIFHGQQPTYAAALNNIEHSEADIAMVIPEHYSRDITLGRMPQVLIQSKISTLYLYNKHLNFKLFMIPALFAIVMMLMTGFLPTLNIVSEKEAGTIEQINATPISKWTFILAKLIPYWVIAFFIITVCLFIAWAVYGITSKGNIALIYLLAMLLALFFSSCGLIISNYSDTMQQAIFVMWFFVVILLLLSGLFTPTRSMPSLAYLTTYINPVSYFIEAMRTVFIRGGNFSSISHQVFALLSIGMFMGSWAVISYKKNN